MYGASIASRGKMHNGMFIFIDLFSCTAASLFNKLTYLLTYLLSGWRFRVRQGSLEALDNQLVMASKLIQFMQISRKLTGPPMVDYPPLDHWHPKAHMYLLEVPVFQARRDSLGLLERSVRLGLAVISVDQLNPQVRRRLSTPRGRKKKPMFFCVHLFST